jgi:diguanylate cyclase (GGDEF)-like protein/PAS domain S-box-containing protein
MSFTNEDRLEDRAGTAAVRLLNAIAALAAQLCATPVALITRVENQRHAIKAASGWAPAARPFDLAACPREQLEILEVPDTHLDSRLREHELVRSEPHMRFFASTPLTAETGGAIGSLCVLDRTPRSLTATQRAALERVAGVAAQLVADGSGGSELAGVEVSHAVAQARGADHYLRDMAENIPLLLSFVDRQEHYRFFNRAYQDWFGRQRRLELGMTVREMIGVEAYERAKPYIARCLKGENVSFEIPLATAHGNRHVLVNYVPHWGGGSVDGFYTLVSDLTAQKEAEEALFQEKERLAVTLQSIGDGVITTDIHGKVTYINPLAEALTGWRNAQALGRPLSEVFTIADAETKQRAVDPVMLALATNAASGLTLNTVLMRADGSELPIEDSAAPIHDRSGNVIGGVLVFRDMSATQAMAVKMTHLAQHDALTHLPNRLLLKDRVVQAIGRAARHGTRVALMFLDLDRFKHVNDSLGHAIGDKLLQNVAGRLLGCVRASDTVCRQGGDEFVVLLPEIDEGAQAARVADKILSAVALPYVIDAHELHISMSAGISVYPDDAKDAEAMSKNADSAMYHAKEQGRNNFQFFTPELNTRVQARATMESNLRRALRRDEFILHYQPKVCLRTGNVIGAEALLRWRHPELGLILPDRFIGVAEEAGMIVPIGQWVVRAVCEQLGAWIAAGRRPLPIAINVSGAQVRDKGFMQDLRYACNVSDVQPELIELELTESVLMQDAPTTAEMLRALKSMGLRLSIDDFGTGYSSLSYLKRFPIDALKIDRSFVRDISEDPDDAAIVSAIISMAKSLKQEVVAEGVETQAQLDFLRQRQCDQMQGYLFSKPITAQALAQQFFVAP